jgi:hypothetical protein
MSSQNEYSSEKPESLSKRHTNECYKQTLVNLGIDSAKDDYWDQKRARKQEIGKEYIRLVRTLPEEVLSLIVDEHNKGILYREDSTIEEVLDELALRILLKDQHD